MAELELVSTDDLIKELSNRHTELIVIRENYKQDNADNVFVKTPFGKLGKKKKGFDLIVAIDMLNATARQLAIEYCKK